MLVFHKYGQNQEGLGILVAVDRVQMVTLVAGKRWNQTTRHEQDDKQLVALLDYGIVQL